MNHVFRNYSFLLLGLFVFSCGEEEERLDANAYECDSNVQTCNLADLETNKAKEVSGKGSGTSPSAQAINCPEGESYNSEKSACVSFSEFGTDLKSCKALIYKDEARTELSLKDQSWCGDFAGRFSKKQGAATNDYVYDWLLRGYWSEKSSSDKSWPDAGLYCSKLGVDWELPDPYKLLSLFSRIENDTGGYINPIFEDNDKSYFWSSLRASSGYAWRFYFMNAELELFLVLGASSRVRCFRFGDY